jgi:hypothetical protein
MYAQLVALKEIFGLNLNIKNKHNKMKHIKLFEEFVTDVLGEEYEGIRRPFE